MNSGKHSLIIGTWTDLDSFTKAYKAMKNRHKNKDLDAYYNDYATMIHTYYDFKIVPTERPVFAAPEPKTDIVEIPGADFHLDLSEALTGYPLYGPREGDIEFIALNGFGEWQERFSAMLHFFHGKNNLKIILEDDPGFYYSGRLSVSKEKSDKHNNFITVEYVLEPYKTRLQFPDILKDGEPFSPWLWDPFDLKHGIIYSRLGLTSGGQLLESSVFGTNGKTIDTVPNATGEYNESVVENSTPVAVFYFPASASSDTATGLTDLSEYLDRPFFGRKPVEPKITVSKIYPNSNSDNYDGKIWINFINQDAALSPGTLIYDQEGNVVDFESGVIKLDASNTDRKVVSGIIFTDQTKNGVKAMKVRGRGVLKIEFTGGEL